MMSIFPVLLMVLSLSITGSGRDMLDYMGTDVYWKQKSVTVTPENMLAELGTGKGETVGDISPLIKQLGDENYKARKDAFAKIKALGAPVIPQLKAAKEAATDPDVKDACERLIGGFTGATKSGQVRRLMAIRTLGELKDKSALPALQKLTDSKEQFVADYANAAIASINGTPYTRPGATAEQRASDVAMLPAEVGAVLQLSANGGQTVPLQRLLDQAFKSIGDNSPEAQEQKNRTITEMNAGILKTLEQMGNIRVDVATVGISNQVGPNQGFGVIIVRGQYDPTALSPLTSQMTASTIDGTAVYSAPFGGPTLIPLADRFVIVAEGGQQGTMAKTMIAALKANKGTFATNADMAKLIKTINVNKPIWGVAQISNSYRMAPPLAPFDTLTMAADAKDGALQVDVAASGSDEAKTKSTVDWTNTQIQNGIEEVKKASAFTDVTPVLELLQSIKVEAKGKDATASATIKGGTESLIKMFVGFTSSVRRVSRPMTAPPVQIQN